MPDVIKFRRPILDKAGETDFALRMLIVDTNPAAPLVKMLLQQVDDAGKFVENGETYSVRHEGADAQAFLSNPTYKAVMSSLPGALVSGTSLPAPADVVSIAEPAP